MTARRLDTPLSERNEIIEQVERYATFILANILWALFSIPLVTLPAATAGLFAVMVARVRGDRDDTIGTFFGGVHTHWRNATALGLLNLLGGGLVVINFAIFPQMDMRADPLALLARSVTIFAALALLMVNVYAWPLLVLFEDLSLRDLIASAVRLALARPFWSLLVVFAAAIVVGASLLLPRGVLVLATASAVAFVVSWGAWRVIKQHVTDET